MLKDFMEWFAQVAQVRTVEVPPGQYSTQELYLPPDEPGADTLAAVNLGSLISYLEANRDRLDLGGLTIQVVNPALVTLLGPADGRPIVHPVFMRVTAPINRGKFGLFMPLQELIIWLMTGFARSADQEALVARLGSVVETASVAVEDDGVSQRTEVKKGVATRAHETLPPIVNLAPYRTFPDVSQVPSPFLLRLESGGRGALFEADNGAWQSVALARVAAWIKAALGRSIALKDADIPVIY